MSKDRDEYVQNLASIKGSSMWIGPGQGPEFYSSIHILTSEGIYTGYSNINRPMVISEREYEKCQKVINTKDEDKYEKRLMNMIKAGCEPGVEYIESDIHDFPYIEKKQYIEDLKAAYEEAERFQPWSDLTDEEIKTYCCIFDYLKNGYSCWEDLPDDGDEDE